MDRRRLECFLALAEELHFHRAAVRCHMTQPALSQQLRVLEEQLQVQLVYRSKRHVALTRAGEVFLDEVRKILRGMDLAVAMARRTERGEIGQLKIGVTAPALYIVFPEIVRAFAQRLPEVGLIVHDMTTAEQEQALRNRSIQLGIVHPPLEDTALSCTLIATTAFNIVLSDQNPLAKRRRLRLRDLANEQFIIFPRTIGPQLYDHIISLCQSEGFSPKVILEITPAQSIIAMAAAGFGIGFIASEYQLLPRPGVVFRKLEGVAPSLSLGVAYDGSDVSPAMKVFLELAQRIGAQVR
ncbi:MAG TPA: LysR substrate-binding domain-containing protein [Bordetella sp.]